MFRKNNYFLDIVLFAFVLGIAIVFWYQGLFIEYVIYFLLWFHIFVVALLLRSIPLVQSSSQSIDLALFIKDRIHDKYYRIKYFLLVNRQYIFPVVLVVYLVFLLIGQTKLWGLDQSVVWMLLNIYDGNILLGVVIASGIATVFQETVQEKYYRKVPSLQQTKRHLLLSVVLSTLAVYIIFGQTQSLGVISYPISIIAGVLLFLIGVMIVEEEDDVSLTETNR